MYYGNVPIFIALELNLKFLALVMGLSIPFAPALALLGLGLEAYPQLLQIVLAHILYASRMTLAQNWHAVSWPSLSSAVSRLNIQCQYEKMLAFKE